MARSHSLSSRCIRSATPALEPLESRQLFNGGGVDTSFGTNGFVRPFAFQPASIAMQADGKTVVAGNLNNQFAVGRIDANGEVDTTFGPNRGVVSTPIKGESVGVSKIAVQPDGKIVVAGTISDANGYKYALVRYNANGSLDTTFGNKGIDYVLGYNDSPAIGGLVVQPNGRIVFAATRDDGSILSDQDILVARLLPNGSLDNTFGDSNGSTRKGYVTTDFNSDDDLPSGVALMPNGQIVVAGTAGDSTQRGWIFARYNPNGTLDKTFDHDGIVGTDFPSYDYLGGVGAFAVKPDGEIYAAGLIGNQQQEFVAHYLPNGQFDVNFGNGGVFPTFPSKYSPPVAIFFPAPGKILIVSSDTHGVQSVQYTSAGKLDPTYGINGQAVVSAIGSVGITPGDPDKFFWPAGALENGHGQLVVAAWSDAFDPSTAFTRVIEETPTFTVSATQIITGAGRNITITVKRDQAYDFDSKVAISDTLTNTGHQAMAVVAGQGPGQANQIVVDIPAGQTQVVLHVLEPIIQPIPVAKGTFGNAAIG